ncbi:MAG TPA: hypothetical protein VII78_14550 [Myxococcota bacterium]
MRRSRAAELAAAAVAAVLLASSASAEAKPRAAAGELLAPAENAMRVVVGTLGTPRPLDAQGWSAELAVERTLAGSAATGAALRVAWEELAPSRAVRFAPGERVLVALDPLPDGSLWSARFPRRDALAVAGRGEAFARAPDAASADALQRYLALPRPQRGAQAGVDALANLARRASESLALEALARLGTLPALAQNLSADARGSLAALIADPRRPGALRAAALTLAGRRKLSALAPEARALASVGGALAPAAVEALGAMSALSPAEAQRYAASRDPALRAAALRGAPGALDATRLEALARSDAAGEVRAAALAALARREGAGAANAAVDALFDADAEVQSAALRALPAFPSESAQLLRARAFGPRANDTEALKPALAGLSVLGRDGAAVLNEIERDHPNAEIRRLAQFLLGRTPAH